MSTINFLELNIDGFLHVLLSQVLKLRDYRHKFIDNVSNCAIDLVLVLKKSFSKVMD